MCIHTCRNVLIFRRGEELDHAIKQVNVQVFKHYTLMNHSLSKIPRTPPPANSRYFQDIRMLPVRLFFQQI